MASVSRLAAIVPQGNTPLHKASEGGHLEVVRALIAEGADLTAKNVRGGQGKSGGGVDGVGRHM